MSMICKSLYYCVYTVKDPGRYQYSLGAYVQADTEEHACICLQDYFHRHSMTAEILDVEWVPNFYIATKDHYPNSSLNEQPIRPFDEAPDLP